MAAIETPHVQLIADYACQTGEGPLWHAVERRLYWTDIPTGRLFWYDPATHHSEQCYSGRHVGGFTIQADGQLLLFRDKGNVVTFRHGEITSTVIESIAGHEETRFNDQIADPEGRVFVGTMSFGGQQNGGLYRVDLDGSYHLISEGHGTPNGMGFSPDLRTFYFCDSRLARIYAYDYDRATGDVRAPRVIVETPKDQWERIGRGDGMTVDSEGNLWSARWDGSQILKFSPRGQLLAQIPMPAKKITSIAFGGEGFEEMYATSAGGQSKDTDDQHAGGLFRLTPGVQGRPEFPSRIRL